MAIIMLNHPCIYSKQLSPTFEQLTYSIIQRNNQCSCRFCVIGSICEQTTHNVLNLYSQIAIYYAFLMDSYVTFRAYSAYLVL